jgi:hypothetical protein
MRWFSRAYLSISPIYFNFLMLSQALYILNSFRCTIYNYLIMLFGAALPARLPFSRPSNLFTGGFTRVSVHFLKWVRLIWAASCICHIYFEFLLPSRTISLSVIPMTVLAEVPQTGSNPVSDNFSVITPSGALRSRAASIQSWSFLLQYSA